MKYYNSLEEVNEEDLKTNDQIIIVKEAGDGCHNITSYKLFRSMQDIIYIFSTNGIVRKNGVTSTKTGSETYVKFNDKYIKLVSNFNSLRSLDKGFTFKKITKGYECQYAFDYMGKLDILIKYEWKNNSGKILREKRLHVIENTTASNISIPECENFDLVVEEFLKGANGKEKDEFMNVINTMNYTREDSFNSDTNKFNEFRDFAIKIELANKQTLNKMNNNFFQLNENVRIHFPTMCGRYKVKFTPTDNNNNVIKYNVTETESNVLNYVSKCYLNKINNSSNVLDPFTGKFDKRAYRVLYESSTGLILSSVKNNNALRYYLKYNGMYYCVEKFSQQEKIKEEYQLYKKMTS